MHDVADLALADAGRLKIEWADRQMPVLAGIRERFERERPLEGWKISACLHVTAETANLMRTLAAGGADAVLCSSNPLSTQDDVAASLVTHFGIPTFAIKGEDRDSYYAHIRAALDHRPEITMDDGADLVNELHANRPEQLPEVLGGTEETTTGVIRLRAMANAGKLAYPVVAVNEALTKHLFDNRYGTGQSAIDGILRATNILFAGKTVVVGGYGWVGRGIASRAHGMGANVVVCEVDPVRALEAAMDGYRVMNAMDAAREGDVFISGTGNLNVWGREHFPVMPDGAILANAGHFNDEFELPALEEQSESSREVRPFTREYRMPDGRRLYVLADGRLVNLGAAEGHPAMVMDMSFANQALGLEWLRANVDGLEPKVYGIPEDIDREVARLKLESMGIRIDPMTAAQKAYSESYESGT
ncbi:MAG TPA: adenosylhomocysteinase [Candidatus Limnocylindria bacterium]|jgi:adenosylhomocysteinase|nr:adenosylhomocysteinase [Candidatus Limnocylindria bacterium]